MIENLLYYPCVVINMSAIIIDTYFLHVLKMVLRFFMTDTIR